MATWPPRSTICSFLLRYAATLPFADASRVAAMGHSYGAQAMLAWRARPNSALDAVVFLDSTVEYHPLDDSATFKAALERNRNSAVPVLMFADSRRQPRFEVFDPYLAFAARHEVTWTAWNTTLSSARARSARTIPCTATTRPSAS